MSIKTVQATVNGQTYNLTLNESTGKYEAVITAPSGSSFKLDGGYYPVSMTATDTAGNSTSIDTSHSTLGENLKLYVKEQVKPTITIVRPSAGAYVTNSKPEISFTIKDDSTQTTGFSGINPDSIVLKINGTTVNGNVNMNTDGSMATVTYTPQTNLPDGECTITIDGSDNDGNAADTVEYTFKIDTLAPSLIVTSPSDGFETNKAALTVSGTTDDVTSKPVTVTITLNGADQGSVTVESNGSFSKGITLDQQGENTIVITATDSAGKATSVTKTVIYNTTAPVFRSVTISPNPVNAGNTYTISVEVV